MSLKNFFFSVTPKMAVFFMVMSSFLAAQNSEETFSPTRMKVFYDLFTADQDDIVDQRYHHRKKSEIVTPIPGKLGYAPLIITNNSGLSSDRLYVIGKGQTLAATDAYFLKPNLSNGVCSLVSGATYNSVDPNISVKLSRLPSAGNNSYYLYIPQMISGRIYLSIDAPLYMETLSSGGIQKINDPSQTTVQDPNYYTLYQDFEFTLDKHYDLYTNVTNVDYFCLPMTLGSYTYPSGKLYPTLDNLTVVGYPLSSTRKNILANIQTGLSQGDASSPRQWPNLVVPFYTNPYIASSPATDLRILAAKTSIALGQNGVQFKGAASKNTQKFFNANYLQSTAQGPSLGQSYMNDLYTHYLSDTLSVIIYPSKKPPATYTMSSSSTSGVLKFESTTSGAPTPITLDLSQVTTSAFFSGAVGDWATAFSPGGTGPYNTELAKIISALYSAGFLPPPSTLHQPVNAQSSYFSTYRGSYFSNPKDFSLNGPWYNLYDQVIHPLLIKTDNYGLGYAYDFDDLLDIAGLLHVNIQTNGVLNQYQPYVVLTLGPVDTTIPAPTGKFGPYTLKVGPLGAGSKPIDIIYSTDEKKSPTTVLSLGGSQQTLHQLQNYFLVRFKNIGASSATLTYKVYPKYQLVLPTTTRYNAQDVSLMNGIVFANGTDGSTFIVTVPNTKND